MKRRANILCLMLLVLVSGAINKSTAQTTEEDIKRYVVQLQMKIQHPDKVGDVSAYADLLYQCFYVDSVNTTRPLEMLGKLRLQSYYLMYDGTKLDYEDIYRTLRSAHGIKALQDSYFFICASALGDYCEKVGDYKRAAEAYEYNLEAHNTIFNDSPTLDRATIHARLALLYKNHLSDADKFTAHSEAAKSDISAVYPIGSTEWQNAVDTLLSKNTEINTSNLLTQADEMSRLGRFDEANALFEQYFAIADSNSEGYLYALSSYINYLVSQEAFEKCPEAFDRILEWIKAHPGIDIIKASSFIGYLTIPTIGVDRVQQLATLLTERHDPDNVGHLALLAHIHVYDGNSDELLRLYPIIVEKADAFYRANNREMLAQCVENLTHFFLAIYDWDNAIKYQTIYVEYLTQMRDPRYAPLVIPSKCVLASFYSMNEDYPKAIEVLEECLNDKNINEVTRREIMTNIASAEFTIGNFGRAITLAEEVFPQANNVPEQWNLLQIIVTSLISEFDLIDKEERELHQAYLDKLQKYITLAYELTYTNYPEEHLNHIYAHLFKASYFLLSEQTNEMLQEAGTAENLIRANIANIDTRNKLLESLTIFYIETKLYEKALALATEASVDNKTNIHRVFTFATLSDIYLGLGRIEDARQQYLLQAECIKGMIQRNFAVLTDENRGAYWQMYRGQIYNAGRYASGADDNFARTLYDLALYSKGLLLNTSKEFERIIMEYGDENAQTLYRQMSEIRNMAENDPSLTAADREALTRQAEEMELTLMEGNSQFKAYIEEREINWSMVKQAMKPNSAAIEFIHYKDISETECYGAVVVYDGWELPKFIELGDIELVDLDTKEAISLSENIWGKISREMDDVDNVYFSPDALLHVYPIELLPDWELPSQTISDRWNMYRLSSTRELVMNTKKSDTPRKAAIYGGLDYDMKSDELVNDGKQYGEKNCTRASADIKGKVSTLSETKVEANMIGKILTKVSIKAAIYTDKKGTESAFKSSTNEDIDIIHLATHGFYYEESESEKQRRMQIASSKNLDILKAQEDYSLTHSGLMMAGVNIALSGDSLPDNVDDGILTANEISQLNFKGLDLVVLSACDTGLGDISGEGVFGLQRGFKMAGAQSLLMSLWKVSDKATQEMMTLFYSNIANGMTKHEALNDARRNIRNKYSDARHWASFVLLDAID